MRVFLTKPQLETAVGRELLELCVKIVADGKVDLNEIKELRRWLRRNKMSDDINAIGHLSEIMDRITADGVIDKEELRELHLAIEKVIPITHRKPGLAARKERDAAKRKREKERQRIRREKEKVIRAAEYEEAHRQRMRIRHDFAKIAGVSFPNDDGTERQHYIANCNEGEQLLLNHDRNNSYSIYATEILRVDGKQLGHAPEYLAKRIVNRIEDGLAVAATITDLTGGSIEFPMRGVNMLVLYYQQDVTSAELNKYANSVLSSGENAG